MHTKKCSKCNQEKASEDFYIRTKTKLLHSACKKCEREMAKDWYEKNKDYAKSKVKLWRDENKTKVINYRTANRGKHHKQEISRKYKVSIDWFDAQLASQEGKCAICSKLLAWTDKHNTPHVDHCHKSGNVRGILCNRCNTVLGLCQESIQIFNQLKKYLKKCHGYSAGN